MQMKQKAWKDKEVVTSWRVSHQWRSNSYSDLFFLQKMCTSHVCLAREKVIISTILLDYGTQPKFRH